MNNNEYINNYKKEKYKRVALEIPKEKYEIVKKHASDRSETVNGFIKRAIDETMQRDCSE